MASSPRSRAVRRRGGTVAAFAVFGAFLLVGILVLGEVFHGVMGGACAFLVHRQLVVRAWLLADHTRGVQLARTGDHLGALAAFEASERAWQRRAVVDRWRAVVLASASRWGFGDQARYNQALCLRALGREDEALAVARSLLATRPDMGVARALVEHLEGTATPSEDWSALEAGLGTEPADG